MNSFAKFDILQSKHVTHCTAEGKVIAEGILTRLSEDEVMLFKSMHSGEIEIAGCKMLALRQGMSGEIGFELQGPIAETQKVHDAVMKAGQEFGIRRLGGRAEFINHLEACFPTIITDYLPAIFSPDMKDYLDLFRANMPSFSTFNLAGSFEADDIAAWYRSPVEARVGQDREARSRVSRTRRARERSRESTAADPHARVESRRRRRGLCVALRERRGVPLHGDASRPARLHVRARAPRDKVLQRGKSIGVSTSRGYSYFFREMLSLAVIDVEHAEIGAEVSVVWGNPGEPQKEVRATIAPAPYKTDRRRENPSRPDTVK